MRRGVCVKCGCNRIAYFPTVLDATDSGTSRLLGWVRTGGLLSGGKRYEAQVEAYACPSCGYFEEYVRMAQSVDWNVFASAGMMQWLAPRAP